jgi:hypothetical protein
MQSRNKRRTADIDSSGQKPAFRTLRGWAIGILLETHAIRECSAHGHMRDRADPDAYAHARDIAGAEPFPGSTTNQAVRALDEVMQSIGDTCPECE